eukprot:m.14353 g.14353  ORF g.14353 m.14353 type:complete len:54 (-) comp7717_c1_seq4:526-687(-)
MGEWMRVIVRFSSMSTSTIFKRGWFVAYSIDFILTFSLDQTWSTCICNNNACD